MLNAVSRLRGRSFAELSERTKQALAKRVERLGLRDGGEPDDAALWRVLRGVEPDAAAWRAHLAQRAAPVLFAGLRDRATTVAALRKVDPGYVAAVVQRAERALGGCFDLLGYQALDFGQPVDWHLDPLSGVRSPEQHWSAIPYLDASVAGDHKVVWELNRHQWLTDLAAAWWITGDDRYGRAMLRLLGEWMDANPPKIGINWASSLEVAFRSISWIWALEFLRHSTLLDDAMLVRMTKYLLVHARHLERYLSTWFSPNTHLTGEALGLYYLGVYFPELAPAERWRERGASVLLEQLPRHVLRDGVYFEQAVHYHRYTVDFYTHLWLLDEANGGTLRVDIAPALEALLEHLQSLTRGDGTVPLLGDEDGGRLFFLDDRPLNDVRSALATGAVLLRRPDFAAVAGAPSAELVWLLGPEGDDAIAALGRASPKHHSRAFEDGGMYVMRDGWEGDSTHLVIDCGPHGTMNCGHAHADALAFELFVAGHPVLVDPGTFTYTTDREARNAFRSTHVHNAATVDKTGSSEPAGPFHWQRIASCRVFHWRLGEDGRSASFEGGHNGFEGLAWPVSYRRAVEFRPDGERLIRLQDIFESGRVHTAALNFQFAPELEVELLSPRSVRVSRDGVSICEMETEGGNGAFRLDDGWVSRRYGSRERAPRCRYITSLTPPRTVLTTTIRWSHPGAAVTPRNAAEVR